MTLPSPSPSPSPWAALTGTRPSRSPAADLFRQAMEIRDFSKLHGLFTEDVVFRGPKMPGPHRGVRRVGVALGTAINGFAEMHYTGHYRGVTGDAETHVLRFHAVDSHGSQLEGVDILEVDGDGLICGLTIMLRPLSLVWMPRWAQARSGSPQRKDAAA